MQYQLIEASDDEQFLEKAASAIEVSIANSLSKSGRCIVGLSGGNTPKAVYGELAGRPIDWANVWLFLIDERYVSPDHPDSNQRMIRQTLAGKAAIPPERLIAPDTLKPLAECVHSYEEAIRELLAMGNPDVVTLGMGEDGHIASLFPPLPDEATGANLIIHTHTDKFAVSDRITVTLPMLQQSGASFLLLKGDAKKQTWDQMLRGKSFKRWPAREVLEAGRCTVVAQWTSNRPENNPANT